MAAMGHESYVRAGDRSPEKPEFFKLPEPDRELIYQLRSAMDVARGKMNKLRNEVEDKERDISRETALRKAAEARLEQLVDMYGDPAVTEELRRRLPRAGKGDPKERLSREIELLSRAPGEADSAGSGRSTGPGERKTRRNLATDLEEQIITDASRRSRSLSADSTRKRRTRTDSGSFDADDDATGRGRRNRSHSPPSNRSRGPSYPGYQTYPGAPYPGYYPQMYPYPLPPPPVPMFYPNPAGVAHQPLNTTPQTPAPVATTPGVPLAHSTPANHLQMAGVYPQAAMTTPLTAASYALGSVNQPTGSTPQPHVTVTPPSNAGLTAGTATARGGGSGGVGVATSVSDSSVGGASGVRVAAVNREQQRQISMLLAELDASKDLNKELQGKLSSHEKDLEGLRLTSQTQVATLQAEKSGKIADLVEEIYRAQKTRDDAMLGRLRVAHEDRDEALQKLKRLQKTLQGSDQNPRIPASVMDSFDDLDNVAVEKLGDIGGGLVERIRDRRQRHSDISTEEMRAVLQERDATIAKCRQLETEVVKLQRITRARGSERQQFSTQQAKLLATQQERDLALVRVRKLEDELQTLRVYYSLHKSLSQEANLRDQYNNKLKNIEGAVKERDSTIEVAEKERNQLVAQIQQLIAEKAAIQEQLDKSQTGHKEAQANCQKLERLVNVLRRKINGLGTKADD